jgi:glycerophosphoryl diester phosphodiesterase
MTDPVSVVRDGHRTFWKWHRARRRASDPVFTGGRILEGMAVGASVEVDLVRCAGGGFAVLHDHLSIARETTGSGAAFSRTPADMRGLRLRDNDGNALAEHVMLFDDLCRLIAENPPHPAALLQLDYKEGQPPLDAPALAAFGRSAAPVGRHMIVSSGEAASVRLLTEAASGTRIGYDPCHGDALEKLRASNDFCGFVATAVADSPDAEMIYLAYPVVLAAAEAGFDIVAAFHAENRRIDAYTIKSAEAATRPIIERLLALRVDQITTDDPEGVAELLERTDAGRL